MTKQIIEGRFVWHELHTTDPAKAKGFYGELFGWTFKDVPMGAMGNYTMISVGGKDVGGLMNAQAGAPPHWLGYCATPDVDAATQRAIAAGAKQIVPPMDIPEVGRFSIVADTTGAVIAPFRGSDPAPETEGRPALGHFCWDELATQDPAAAKKLYAAVFNWGTDDMNMGPMGTYTIWKRGEKQAAGMMKAMDPKAPSAWVHYVHVEKVDASTDKAKRLGANVVVPPTDIPKMGRFSILLDPQNACIALFEGA